MAEELKKKYHRGRCPAFRTFGRPCQCFLNLPAHRHDLGGRLLKHKLWGPLPHTHNLWGKGQGSTWGADQTSLGVTGCVLTTWRGGTGQGRHRLAGRGWLTSLLSMRWGPTAAQQASPSAGGPARLPTPDPASLCPSFSLQNLTYPISPLLVHSCLRLTIYSMNEFAPWHFQPLFLEAASLPLWFPLLQTTKRLPAAAASSTQVPSAAGTVQPPTRCSLSSCESLTPRKWGKQPDHKLGRPPPLGPRLPTVFLHLLCTSPRLFQTIRFSFQPHSELHTQTQR